MLAPQQQSKTVSEIRNVAVSFSGKLDTGELLTGSPTITISDPSVSPEDMTISNGIVSTGDLTINGVTVPTGEAVQFKVTGGTVANSPYTIQISCGTDATPAQTLYGGIVLIIEAD
jgi:hypothetical protein